MREVVSGWLLLPMSDVACDPVILNSLLLLLMGRQPLTDYPLASQEDQVEFLAEFVSRSQPSTNTFVSISVLNQIILSCVLLHVS